MSRVPHIIIALSHCPYRCTTSVWSIPPSAWVSFRMNVNLFAWTGSNSPCTWISLICHFSGRSWWTNEQGLLDRYHVCMYVCMYICMSVFWIQGYHRGELCSLDVGVRSDSVVPLLQAGTSFGIAFENAEPLENMPDTAWIEWTGDMSPRYYRHYDWPTETKQLNLWRRLSLGR